MASHPIRFGVHGAQQHVSWQRLKEFWPRCERWGFEVLSVFDHFYPIFSDPTGNCMEAWTVLSALSQHTQRVRIGVLVTGNGYRNPAILAKMAASLDQVSGGRLNLGLGAGWYELEHRSFGVEFKPVAQRLQALEETIQIIRGMFTHERFSFKGRHYQVADAMCNPKPLQAHVPLMIGGFGEKVLLRIVAQYADQWNTISDSPEQIGHLVEVIEAHGERVGRDPKQIEKSILTRLCYKAPAREAALLAQNAAQHQRSPEETRRTLLIGGKQECLDRIAEFAKVGITKFIISQSFVQDQGRQEEEELQAFAEEVMPAFAG